MTTVLSPAARMPWCYCPACGRRHCVTTADRVWTHGPRTARCPGSRTRVGIAIVGSGGWVQLALPYPGRAV